MSGTFAPGEIGDPTAKGNSCDDANDQLGCIFTQNLLVDDATTDEINAAVSGISASATATSDAAATTAAADATGTCGTVGASTSPTFHVWYPDLRCSHRDRNRIRGSCNYQRRRRISHVRRVSPFPSPLRTPSDFPLSATATASAASGTNLQTFTGALGGISAPAVTAGGRGFVVENNDSFLNLAAALGRSCDVQHNQCANLSNEGGQSFTVGDCDTQDTECRAAAS